MGTLTYNLVVRLPSNHNSGGYSRHIKELAGTYGIQGHFIVCRTNRVTVANFNNGSLETTVFKGTTYSIIPQVVRYYEDLIGQTDTPRWIIALPSVVNELWQGLKNAWVVKGEEYFGVAVGKVYDANTVLVGDKATAGTTTIHTEAERQAVDPLVQLINRATAEEAKLNLGKKE